jgi:hypothetical protein
MKNISILVPETAVAEGVTGPRYLFTTANQFLLAAGKGPLFNVQLVGSQKQVRVQDGVYSITTDVLLADVGQADLVIVPPIFGDMVTSVSMNEAALPWRNNINMAPR